MMILESVGYNVAIIETLNCSPNVFFGILTSLFTWYVLISMNFKMIIPRTIKLHVIRIPSIYPSLFMVACRYQISCAKAI